MSKAPEMKDTRKLGFGLMRLPKKGFGIDVKQTSEMVDLFMDAGFTYFDTAYVYTGSEEAAKKALIDRYPRESFTLATKLHAPSARSEEAARKQFYTSLERTGAQYFDYYLLHSIMGNNYRTYEKYHLWDFVNELKSKGLIRHIGFSFHGNYDLFTEAIDAYPWEFCQIQLNYLDTEIQAGLKGLEYARQRGIDVIIMEPLKGGRLSDKVPPNIQEIWDRAVAEGVASADRSPAEWAFKWVASQPGVSLILSGMSTFGQLDENIEIFSKADIDQMTDAELAVCKKAADKYNSMIKYQCTACRYCMPCPQDLSIHIVIRHLNNWYAFDKNPSSKLEYTEWLDKHGSDCIHCKACEAKCPQRLPISDIMTDAEEQFGF